MDKRGFVFPYSVVVFTGHAGTGVKSQKRREYFSHSEPETTHTHSIHPTHAV